MNKFYLSLAIAVIAIIVISFGHKNEEVKDIKDIKDIKGAPTEYVLTLKTEYKTYGGDKYKENTVEYFYIEHGVSFKEVGNLVESWELQEDSEDNNIYTIMCIDDILMDKVLFHAYGGTSKGFVMIGEKTELSTQFVTNGIPKDDDKYRNYTIKVQKLSK